MCLKLVFNKIFGKSGAKKVVITTETTGLLPEEGHKMVEIAAIEIDADNVPTGAVFHAYINPNREVPEEVVAVHGLDAEFLKDYPTFAEYKDEFLRFIRGKELIGQHIQFDLNFLNNEVGFVLKNKITDTLEMAKKVFPKQKNTLSALCERLEIEVKNSPYNGAMLDVLQTCDIYKKLSKSILNV